MSVLTMRPKTMMMLCARRRGMLRSPIRNSTGLRSAAKASARMATQTIAKSTTAIAPIGMPKSLFMAAPLLAHDLAVAHAHDPMAAGADARVVRHDHECLLLLPVQALE